MSPEERRVRIVSLRNTIANHQKSGKSSEPKCLEAMKELNGLEGGGLKVWESVEAIRRAAEAGGLISYGDLAGEQQRRVHRWALEVRGQELRA